MEMILERIGHQILVQSRNKKRGTTKTHQFLDEFLEDFRVRDVTHDFDGSKTDVTLLKMPLIKE